MDEVRHELLSILARGERIFTYHHLSAKWGYFHTSARRGQPCRIASGVVEGMQNEGYVQPEPFDPHSTSKYIWIVLTEKGRVAIQECPEPVTIPEHEPLPIEDILGRQHITIASKWSTR